MINGDIMKNTLVILLLALLVVVSGCSDSNVDASSSENVAETESAVNEFIVTEDKVWCADYVDSAIIKLKEQWRELYHNDGIIDGVVEIKNTHVYLIKQPNDIVQFSFVNFVVQFDLYTTYDMTKSNSSNKGMYETVVFLNTGDVLCYKYNPLLMYSIEADDYAAFVEKDEDFGNIYNEMFLIEQLTEIVDTTIVEGVIGKNANGYIKDEKGNIIISKSDVKLIAVKRSKEYGCYFYIELTDAGTEKFAKATSENIGKTLSLYINDTKLLSPSVMEAITDGKLIIAQNSEIDEIINIFIMLTQ